MANSSRLNVYRGARRIGVLDMADGESFYGFAYARDYLFARDAVPLSASLPLSPERRRAI